MKFDYVIIGAGVIGSSTAYHLKREQPESRIVLIDKNNRAGAGNTAKSAALYRNLFSSQTSRLLASSSIYYYQQLGEKIQLNPIGYLWLFSEHQWEILHGAINQLDPGKDQFEVLDREGITDILEIRTATSAGLFPDVHKGIYGHLCGSLSGMALAEHYTDEFRSLGGVTRFGTEIESFTLTGEQSRYAPWDTIEIKGARDQKGTTYCGAQFIVATGSWTHELLAPIGIASGVLPKKRQLFGIALKDVAQVFRQPNLPQQPAVILPAGGVYIKPLIEKNFLIVGCADDLGQPYIMADARPDVQYFHKAIEPVLLQYFPALAGYQLTLKWAGYYAYHWPDKNPVVESVSNLTWASGTSGSGIMKADALGRITAARVQGHHKTHLADGTPFKVSTLSLWQREAEKEKFII
jgi:glycine/D-amino acid oxidase-like deaminating enzyme